MPGSNPRIDFKPVEDSRMRAEESRLWNRFAENANVMSLHVEDRKRFIDLVIELHQSGSECPSYSELVARTWPEMLEANQQTLAVRLDSAHDTAAIVMNKASYVEWHERPETEPESEQPEPATGKMTQRFRLEGEPTDALGALLDKPVD